MLEGGASTIWTIGHSNRASEEFIRALQAHQIELVADVRRFPGSKRLPHYGAAALESSLADAGIGYRHLPSLGGRRSSRPDSPNTTWRVAGFRGYADHIETEEFAEGLLELSLLAGGLRTAFMCAEILWWQCHRRLIADVFTALEWRVLHIRDETPAAVHVISAPARIVGGSLSYQADKQLPLL